MTSKTVLGLPKTLLTKHLPELIPQSLERNLAKIEQRSVESLECKMDYPMGTP